MLNAAKTTAAIVSAMGFETIMTIYMPITIEIAATGIIAAYASVKIDEYVTGWRIAR